MKMALHFELVTPEKLVRSEDVYMVVVPGTEGDFGVLEGHAPFMSIIRPGELTVYSGPNSISGRIQIEGGFAEVSEKGLTVLAEQATEAA
jgi:F-type H+-transporting ATPase subunit epsilon